MTQPSEIIARVAVRGSRKDCRALADLGAPIIPLLGPYLENGWKAQCIPWAVLRMVRGAGLVEALAEIARGEELAACMAAVDALGHTRAAEALPILLDLLRQPENQRIAAEALGHLGNPAAIPHLHAVLDQIQGAYPRRDLAGFIANDSSLKVIAAITIGRALAQLGDHGFADTCAWLAGTGKGAPAVSNAEVRLDAVAALVEFSTEVAVRALVAAQRDPHDEIAAAAIRAIAGIGLPGCVPTWLDMLARRRGHDLAISQGLIELTGSAPPDLTADLHVRRWWAQVASRMPSDVCVWRGHPASPASAIEKLATRDGARARWVLERWTGIDFVDNMPPNVAGVAVDVARARSWWQDHETEWKIGGLYRAGKRYEIMPIAAVLSGG